MLADPGYPCNRHFVELVDGKPVAVPVGAETGYQLTAELVEQAWRPDTKAVLLASPSNPTGTLLSLPEIAALHAVVTQRDGALIVDEIYQGLVYDETGGTALALADDIFVINSFSKYFGMTGWRLGWLVAPQAFIDPLDRLAQNIYLSAPTLSQYAALDAFSPAGAGDSGAAAAGISAAAGLPAAGPAGARLRYPGDPPGGLLPLCGLRGDHP